MNEVHRQQDQELLAAFMRRTFQLGRLGKGSVSPNPMVGAILRGKHNKIIGEGWHRRHGDAHAEIHAFRSVKPDDRHLIPESTLFVSLEPCCIFGKTPPCTQAIIDQGVKKVVLSAIDRTAAVAGRGVHILRDAGVEVTTGTLPEMGRELAAIRNTFVTQAIPFVFLKFAHSADGFLGQKHGSVPLSNPFNKRLVHRWRAEVDAILVGTETALIDNPRLNVRHGPGRNPIRIVIDRTGRLPHHLHLFDGTQPTWVLTEQSAARFPGTVEVIQTDLSSSDPSSWLRILAERRITSLMVEGGARLLTSFLTHHRWHRAAVTRSAAILGNGVPAPSVSGQLVHRQRMLDNELTVWRNTRFDAEDS